jgi:hypothetical protein
MMSAAEFRVAGPVDLAHSARADWRDDLVRTDARSCLERHRADYRRKTSVSFSVGCSLRPGFVAENETRGLES